VKEAPIAVALFGPVTIAALLKVKADIAAAKIALIVIRIRIWRNRV